MIQECITGKGRPKSTSPDFIKMDSGILCTALGVQAGGCSFVDAIFFILQPCIDDFLGAFLDILSGKGTSDKFNFKIAERVFDTLNLIADAATLLEAIDPNKGIKMVDFCRDKPANLPDKNDLKLGLTAFLLCNSDQLLRQVGDIWHYDNWYKYCECEPKPEDFPEPPQFKIYPPASYCGQASSIYVTALNNAQAQATAYAAGTQGRFPGYLQELADQGLSEGLDFWISTSRNQSLVGTGLSNRAEILYGYPPFYACCRAFYYLSATIQDIVIGRTGQQTGQYYGSRQITNVVYLLDRIEVRSLAPPCSSGLLRDLKCSDYPQLCPCKEKISEQTISVSCDEKDIQALTYLSDECPTLEFQYTSAIDCEEKSTKTLKYPYYDPNQGI